MATSIHTPSELLDHVKSVLNTESDGEVCRQLGVNRATVSRMRNNLHNLSEYYVLLMCEIGGLNPAETLANLRIFDAKEKGDEKVVKMWETFAIKSKGYATN